MWGGGSTFEGTAGGCFQYAPGGRAGPASRLRIAEPDHVWVLPLHGRFVDGLLPADDLHNVQDSPEEGQDKPCRGDPERTLIALLLSHRCLPLFSWRTILDAGAVTQRCR